MRFAAVASITLAASVTASSAPAQARADCAGSLGCIAGTQYCSYNGHLTNLHIACGDNWEGGDDGDDGGNWKRDVETRADCAGSLGCIAGTQYCSYNGKLTNLHIACGDNWENEGDDGDDDGDNWKRGNVAVRIDCPGSLGCIAGTQYCSYNNGSLISLHIACGDNWEGSDDGDDWKREVLAATQEQKRYTCSGSIGCVAGTEYCSYGDNNGWHWDNMGTPCKEGDAPIYMTDDDHDPETSWTGTGAHTHTTPSTTSWTTVLAAPTTSVTVITTTPSGASAATTITSAAVITPTVVAAVSGTSTKSTSTTSISKAGAPRATAGVGLLAGLVVAAML
ncbi:hypothetical protein G7054_g5164 [Neopestalotiopsis clavispora]|nr:hypothetical protein G7054_g5164 [Neopestalotiopsis clavispora]